MNAIKYIHAGSLDLGRPFSGITRNPALCMANLLINAPYDALSSLIKLCELEKPDFLIIAGNIFGKDGTSL